MLLSLLALVALLPLFIVVACILRFTGEGEIFFRQRRVGVNGTYFNILKFVTMLKNSPNMGAGTITLDKDPRVLPVGQVLRRTKINELPQLWNVFIGDMSLIGPRPQTKDCFDAFSVSAKQQLVTVRPGLSGVGSIIFRSEEKMLSSSSTSENAKIYSGQIMRYKGELEAWYVENESLGLYFLLIFLTVWYVVNPKTNAIHSCITTLPKASPDIEALIRSAS
tara:strand:+ start:114 stop:779 length:666 start_codon:yes stop_codon:yes gene_type:complete